MKTPIKFRWVMGMASLIASLYAHAYPGESIVLDPVTGNYTITYWDDINYSNTPNGPPAGLQQTTFVPATKIIPTISSRFRLGKAGSVAYSYTMSNGATAKQAIVMLSLEQTARLKGERDLPAMTAPSSELTQAMSANMSTLGSPKNWRGNINRVPGYSNIFWQANDVETGGVQAGSTQAGFSFSSPALPSVGEARMEGLGGVFGYAGEGPADDSAILPELNRLKDNDFVSRNAAVPTIAVPDPFDAATLLERIQTHMHTWLDMKLLDTTFSSQLDRYFQSAISAYRLNQPKVGKKQIQTMRELLKKEHADVDRENDNDDRHEKGDHDDKNKPVLIDKLAARVLDFDLRYVTKRMGKDRDD
jgi:hypothetical protein